MSAREYGWFVVGVIAGVGVGAQPSQPGTTGVCGALALIGISLLALWPVVRQR